MKKGILRIFLIVLILVATLISFIFDYQLLSLLDHIKNPSTDFFFSILLFLQKEPYFEIWLILFVFLNSKKDKKNFFKFLISLVIVALLVILLKKIISRPRPLIGKDSFPSGHSALLFTTFPFINKKILPYWIFFVILLCFTRAYFKIHFFSDLLFSFFISYFVTLLIKKWKK